MNKEQLTKKLESLPYFEGKIKLEFIKGFMTNNNYLVYDNNNKYFLKVGNFFERHGVSRLHEIEASKAGHTAGISPAVIYSDNKIIIFEYIDMNHLTSEKIKDKKTLKRIVNLLKFVHNEIFKCLENKNVYNNVFQFINNKIVHLNNANSPHAYKIKNYLNDYRFFKKEFENNKVVFTHNDLFYKNILDDGKKLYLVDWEYSGFNSCFLDLANLSKNNDFSEDDDSFVLKEYFGNSITSRTIYKLYAFKCISILNEILWSMISEIFSEKVFDYVSYTNEKVMKYEKEFDYFKSLKI